MKTSLAAAVLLLTALLAGCGEASPIASKPSKPESASFVIMESRLDFPKTTDGKMVLKWDTRELFEKMGRSFQSGDQLRALFPEQFPGSTPKITYAIHSEPGEEQGLYLQRFPDTGRFIRATLTLVDAGFKPLGEEPIVTKVTHDPRSTEHIKKKYPFRINMPMPEKTDALYTMVTELVEKDGTVADSVVSVLYVPGEVVNAELKTDKDVYARGDFLRLQIVNNGPTNLSFGSKYLIEKREGEQWIPMNEDRSWTMELYMTTPESDFTKIIELSDYEAGTYRLSKSLGVEAGDIGATLYKTFTIR